MTTAAERNDLGIERRLKVVQSILSNFGLQGNEITPVEYFEKCPFPFNNFIYKVALSSPATAESFRGARNASGVAPTMAAAPTLNKDGSIIDAGELNARSQDTPALASSNRGDESTDLGTSRGGNVTQRNMACVNLPVLEGVTTFIVRLSNPHGGGMNNTNRVENEVAGMHIARQALAPRGQAHLIPRVYAWKEMTSQEEEGFGWVIMEYMEGTNMDAEYRKLGLEQKKVLAAEVAGIFHAIQSAELPIGVDHFGGLTINDHGNIVSGQATLVKGGPWESYEEYLRAKMEIQLEDVETEVIKGWRANGVRERIDKFIYGGKHDSLVKAAGIDIKKFCLVHHDFTMNNMLFDATSGKITAVLDFDWMAITHPFEEYWMSFRDVGGCLPELENEILRQSMLSGQYAAEYPGPAASGDTPEETKTHNEAVEAWEISKTWDGALKAAGVIRPSEIAGVEVLEQLSKFRDLLAPHMIAAEGIIKKRGAENLMERRNKVETEIVEMLDAWE